MRASVWEAVDAWLIWASKTAGMGERHREWWERAMRLNVERPMLGEESFSDGTPGGRTASDSAQSQEGGGAAALGALENR